MKWTKNNSECEFAFVDVKFKGSLNSSLPTLSNCKQFFHKNGNTTWVERVRTILYKFFTLPKP